MTSWREDSEKMKAREPAATKGPWTYTQDGTQWALRCDAQYTGCAADGEFIAQARTDLPAVIRFAELLAAELLVEETKAPNCSRTTTERIESYWQQAKAEAG